MKNKKKIQKNNKKKEVRKAKKMYKQVKTTLDWMDIAEVDDNQILLKSGYKIKGICVKPVNIFIETRSIQRQFINNIRVALNNINFPIYWGFVFTPVNINEHISQLMIQLEKEYDDTIRKMIENDIQKAYWFIETHRELEFYLMVKEKDSSKLEKQMNTLASYFSNCGFKISYLTKNNFYDYLGYVFENQTINDFYFSRGVFQCLQDVDKYKEEMVNENVIEYDTEV